MLFIPKGMKLIPLDSMKFTLEDTSYLHEIEDIYTRAGISGELRYSKEEIGVIGTVAKSHPYFGEDLKFAFYNGYRAITLEIADWNPYASRMPLFTKFLRIFSPEVYKDVFELDSKEMAKKLASFFYNADSNRGLDLERRIIRLDFSLIRDDRQRYGINASQKLRDIGVSLGSLVRFNGESRPTQEESSFSSLCVSGIGFNSQICHSSENLCSPSQINILELERYVQELGFARFSGLPENKRDGDQDLNVKLPQRTNIYARNMEQQSFGSNFSGPWWIKVKGEYIIFDPENPKGTFRYYNFQEWEEIMNAAPFLEEQKRTEEEINLLLSSLDKN